MMFIWFLAIGLIVYFLVGSNGQTFYKKNTVKQELNERLAKGEISIQEYNEIIRIIKEEKNESN